MNKLQETLIHSIKQALETQGVSYEGEIVLDHPTDLSHGDFTTNIAMVCAKQKKQNPQELAHGIVEFLKKENFPHISDVVVAGPGFINITLSSSFFADSLQSILKNSDTFGTNTLFENKKVLLEHSSPNLFKPFHIGHLMNNTVGESLVRLYQNAGADTTVIAYPSDVSLGIGKAVWKLLEYGVETLDTFNTQEEQVAFLGQCYVEGTRAFDEQDIETRVREITQELYEERDTEAYRAYMKCREINLNYFTTVTARLGSHFDGYIFESEAGVVGKKVVLEHTPEVYTESNGAIIYEGEQDGLHTRVFINKDGNPTYEAKDTGLLKIKFDRYDPSLSVFVTDVQQGPYFEVVASAAGKIQPRWKEKTIHALHGRMQFKGEEMSSRLGNSPKATEILDVVNEEVKERSDMDMSEVEADVVSLAALKYTILRTQTGKSINFDPETSLSFEGDSGPYLQYTYARTQSLLRKAREQEVRPEEAVPQAWEVIDLERILYRFPEVGERAVNERHPHLIVTYLTEVARLFNTWYGSTQILQEGDEDNSYRLALTHATACILKRGLWMLGIEAPERM